MSQIGDVDTQNRTQLRVLAVDDDPGDAALLRRHLGSLPRYEIEFTHVTDFDAALEALKTCSADVVFLDYMLGSVSGHQVLKTLRAGGDILPIIMLTGCGDETIAAALMRDGADDYLVKGDIHGSTLGRAIESARAKYSRRTTEAHNRQLLEDLQVAKTMLELKNRRLAELYDTAHQFVDHVSHEFRTPLTVIREFASMIRDRLVGEVNPEQWNFLDIIVHRVDDLALLIDDMLDISKLESGLLGIARTDCFISEVIDRVRPILDRRAQMANCVLSVVLPAGVPRIYCDPEKVGRVIINLVINALKICPDKGLVELIISENTSESAVTIAIRDNGPGIAAETLKSLFERFRQVAGQARAGVKGFGLGLSIAKELVLLNLGEISVESKVGVGSTFSFTVPYSDRRPLIERYLRRIDELRPNCEWIGLFAVHVDSAENDENEKEFEDLIRHVIRRSDLFFRTDKNRWLLVVPTTQPELSPIISRIEKAHEEALRNHPGNFEQVGFSSIGCWHIQDDSESFISAFLSNVPSLKEHEHV